MEQLRSDPAANIVEDIFLGYKRFLICRLAAKVGICDDIEAFSDPATSRDISERRGLNPDIVERLLDSLVTSQLLKKETSPGGTSRYENTPTSKKYLTGEAAVDFVDRSDFNATLWPRITNNIADAMNGESIIDVDTVDKLFKEPFHKTMHKQFVVSMDSILTPNLKAMVSAFDLGMFRRAVDLGGGTGLLGKELVQQYPLLDVTVFDLPSIIQVTETRFAEDTTGRLHTVAGNVITETFPTADLYIVAHVLHIFNEQTVNQLVKTIYQQLPPGGALVVFEKFLDDDRTQPCYASYQNLLLKGVSEGRERTCAEYKTLLEQQGFVDIKSRIVEGINYVDAMIGRKPV